MEIEQCMMRKSLQQQRRYDGVQHRRKEREEADQVTQVQSSASGEEQVSLCMYKALEKEYHKILYEVTALRRH